MWFVLLLCVLLHFPKCSSYGSNEGYHQDIDPDWVMISGWINQPKCVDIPSNLTLCQNLGYSYMRLPNLLDHDTINEAIQQSKSWMPLIDWACHPDTKLFLCSLFSPICLDRKIYPCRSFCNAVKSSYEQTMLFYNYSWSDTVRCDNFPENSDLCIMSLHNVTSERTEKNKRCRFRTNPKERAKKNKRCRFRTYPKESSKRKKRYRFRMRPKERAKRKKHCRFRKNPKERPRRKKRCRFRTNPKERAKKNKRCRFRTNPKGIIRLANGNRTSGRIEVFYNGSWGTICDDYWDNDDAHVACRMLGLNGGIAKSLATYGQGTGSIWLDDLNCGGSESSLFDCYHLPVGEHNCRHLEDAGVVCS